MPDSPESAPQGVYNTSRISEFAQRTRELGHYLNRQVLDRGDSPLDDADREALLRWAEEARSHTNAPDAMDVEYLRGDQPVSYRMVDIVFQQVSELIRDFD